MERDLVPHGEPVVPDTIETASVATALLDDEVNQQLNQLKEENARLHRRLEEIEVGAALELRAARILSIPFPGQEVGL